MRPGARSRPRGPNIYVARRAFRHDVRELLTSDFDKNADLASLGSKARSCVSAMFVIITSARDLLRNIFRHMMNIDRFHDWRPLDKPRWPYQSPGVRADAQC